MKKSNFVALILGTIGGILFALGMCMALIPEWNAFNQGVVLGVIGAVVLLIMVLIWRKMENKSPVKLSGKMIGTVLLGIVGALTLGIGMCLTMVWSNMIIGIIVGIVGVILLLCLITIRNIGVADALVSMLTLQTTMLASFQDTSTIDANQMNGITGLAVCILMRVLS